MIAGYKTISWVAGVLVAVTTSPEMQALIQEYPVAAFWINNIIVVILRYYTVAPLPWSKAAKQQKGK
ncbi:MAG: hypothetical protein ACK502_07940 [Alphaproteobacteria bacterium]|jgi:hypothetical protein